MFTQLDCVQTDRMARPEQKVMCEVFNKACEHGLNMVKIQQTPNGGEKVVCCQVCDKPYTQDVQVNAYMLVDKGQGER